MKVGSAFPSTYLKADDLGGARPVVTIEKVAMEDLGDESKPIVYFRGKDKGLVLNRTNAASIAEILGTDEMDDWKNGQIQLFTTKVDFQGRRVLAIRVEAPPKGRKPPAPPPPPASQSEAEFQATDDDVPF
jgi:hypothetical protein